MNSIKYKGMTLNEMLFEANLINDFETAIKIRDVRQAMEVLSKINILKDDAEKIINTIFQNPKKFGF